MLWVMSCGSCPAWYHLHKEVNDQPCIPSLQGKSKCLKPTCGLHSFSQDTLAFCECACNLRVTTESHCVCRVRKQATKRKEIEKEIHRAKQRWQQNVTEGSDNVRLVSYYIWDPTYWKTIIMAQLRDGRWWSSPGIESKLQSLKKPLHPEGTKNNVITPNPSSHEMKI